MQIVMGTMLMPDFSNIFTVFLLPDSVGTMSCAAAALLLLQMCTPVLVSRSCGFSLPWRLFYTGDK